jgi:hypothetical protein
MASFSELPVIATADEARRVHQTARLFFVKRQGKAHTRMDCDHLSDTELVENPAWRVATDAQGRTLGIPWCDDC